MRTLRLAKGKEMSHALCAGCQVLLFQVRGETWYSQDAILAGTSAPVLCPCDTRKVEDRMVKSGKEQMPHNRVMIGPSLQGLGESLVPLCFGKASLSL